MAVSNTEIERVVALIDTTTGVAFGPYFNSVAECDDFSTWFANKQGSEFIFGHERLIFIEDLRKYRPQELGYIVGMFRNESSSS